jgi:hypothetical protein
MSDPERNMGGVLVAHPLRITDPETPLRLLHKGFDGFDVAFQGALRPSDIEILEAARTQAEASNQHVLVELGPAKVAMHVAETGARGGYRYRCDTGSMGATLFFKKGQTRQKWNIRISVKSKPLAVYGIKVVWSQLSTLLEGLGIDSAQESIGRADYAVDFVMPDQFTLKADQFVVHSRTTNSERSTVQRRTDGFGEQIHLNLSGRVPSSVTLGKMPGRQIIAYDKRKEIIQHQKLYWYEIWGIDRTDSVSIWRIEIRAGKKHLKYWKIRTFQDLENQFGDLVEAALKAVRYVRETTADSNVSRLPLHPLWLALQKETMEGLFDYRSGVIPEHIIEGEREKIAGNYDAQVIALLPGALIAHGFDIECGVDSVAKYFASLEKIVRSRPDWIREKLLSARERLVFTIPRKRE